MSLGSFSLAISSVNYVNDLAKQGNNRDHGAIGAHRIEECTKYVQHALQQDPAESHTLVKLFIAIYGQAVNDRTDTRDSQAHEHQSTVGSPCWSTKVLEPGNN